ncbi:MAG: acyl carrier protein [Gemmataceae bacterium]
MLLWFAPTAEGMRVFDVASIKNLRERVLTIVGDNLGLNIDQLLHSPAFLEDMWADSLDLAELIMDLEQEFDLTIAAEEAFGLRTLGDVIDYLESRLC